MGGPAVRDFQSPRRSLYIMTVRSDRTGFGPLFDVADLTASADHRVVSTVAPQALFLLNNPFALQQTKGLAQRLLAIPGDDRSRIRQAYLILYGRPATEPELRIGLKFLAQVRSNRLISEDHSTVARLPMSRTMPRTRHNPPPKSNAHGRPDCQILLCANEFMYVD